MRTLKKTAPNPIKKAIEVVGLQPDQRIWVLNRHLQYKDGIFWTKLIVVIAGCQGQVFLPLNTAVALLAQQMQKKLSLLCET